MPIKLMVREGVYQSPPRACSPYVCELGSLLGRECWVDTESKSSENETLAAAAHPAAGHYGPSPVRCATTTEQ
ncbi:hypothetical protein V6N11_039607 [Hibiscus sabdariffa]|uniref:Uncharacterized protein n=1 Tax=Hibiscus sabdariffa TaxID=183260 RepID=A0ABR2SN95_9ROSI